MTQTSADAIGRRAALDSAKGMVSRVGVILYFRLATNMRVEPLLAEARAHAGARDWETVGTYVDACEPSDPLEEQPGWQQAKATVESGKAQGIITGARAHLTLDENEHELLTDWLAEHGAFIQYIGQPSHRGAKR